MLINPRGFNFLNQGVINARRFSLKTRGWLPHGNNQGLNPLWGFHFLNQGLINLRGFNFQNQELLNPQGFNFVKLELSYRGCLSHTGLGPNVEWMNIDIYFLNITQYFLLWKENISVYKDISMYCVEWSLFLMFKWQTGQLEFALYNVLRMITLLRVIWNIGMIALFVSEMSLTLPGHWHLKKWFIWFYK